MKIPRNEIEWVKTRVIRHENGPVENDFYDYEIILPRPLADWDVFNYWEKERFDSMRDNLKLGDILFDVGTEVGWTNIIYAKFVGGENMVLVEPTPDFWPNIQLTWEKNELPLPKATFAGFFGDKTTVKKLNSKPWPEESGGPIIDKLAYKYIHEHKDIPAITIDDFVKKTGIVPDALTMDIEGGELLVLRGALETLKRYKPKLWISIHPDLALRDYGFSVDDHLEFLEKLGYEGQFLAEDHERHWYFK